VRVSWTNAARQDLLDLYDYISLAGSPTAALSYVTRIEAFADTFGDFPQSGHARDDIRPGLRVRSFRSAVIAYEIVDTRVDILRVVHAARDYQRELKNRPW
jgi:toxin ParE1/3/4